MPLGLLTRCPARHGGKRPQAPSWDASANWASPGAERWARVTPATKSLRFCEDTETQGGRASVGEGWWPRWALHLPPPPTATAGTSAGWWTGCAAALPKLLLFSHAAASQMHKHTLPRTVGSSAPGTCARRGQVCCSCWAIPCPAASPSPGGTGPFTPPYPSGCTGGSCGCAASARWITGRKGRKSCSCRGSVLAEQGPLSLLDRKIRQR